MTSYHSRLHFLQQTLQRTGCNALLIDDQTNLYYLTGLDLSAGYLFVHTEGAELMVDGRYIEMAKGKSPFPVHLVDSSTLSGLLTSERFGPIRRLGFDSEKTSYKQYDKWRRICDATNPVVELVPIDAPLERQRAIKDPNELCLLQEAAKLGSEGFDYVCSLFKEGMTEKECAAELEIFWKRKGSKTVAFSPIIAFGPNSSLPHHRAGNDRLKLGQIVLVDIGVNLDCYHSDMTRVVFFGQPDPTLLAIHSIVQKAQKAALDLCRPGTLLGDLDAAARDLINAQGYGDKFTHSLGHGIGLNIHEFPIIKNVDPYKGVSLEPGMVITIEPGIYLPGIGGVRIEDTVAITREGYENLTNRPTDLLIVNEEQTEIITH